ncbi:MAG: DnaJ domain-containing protein [Kofleriaceae bacterium]
MDLREAYRVLELSPGATEEAVRDARKTLAKVWHPDRHANDPELQKKAEQKLADINTAFEAVRDAKFPPAPAAGPAPTPKPAPVVARPPEPAKPMTYDDLVPRRRVRPWVIVLVIAALGIAAYFAFVKLGAKSTPATTPPKPDAAVVIVDVPVDAAVVVTEDDPPDAAVVVDVPPAAGDAITIGSTREQVRAIQGAPKRVFTVITEDWSYGFGSAILFDPKTGRVVGWRAFDVKLKVTLVPRDAAVAAKAKAAGTFGKGSTKDEVIAVQGTPQTISQVINETWTYGHASRVEFDKAGTVIEWSEFDVKLKTR